MRILLLLSIFFVGCEEADLQDRSRPSTDGADVPGFDVETTESVAANQAATITLSKTTLSIPENSLGEDAEVRLRKLESKPERAELASLGEPIGDVIEVTMYDKVSQEIFASSLLDQPYTVNQVLSNVIDPADLMAVVLTSRGKAGEVAQVLSRQAITVSAALTGDDIIVSFELNATDVTFYLAAAKEAPASVNVLDSGAETANDSGGVVVTTKSPEADTSEATNSDLILHLGMIISNDGNEKVYYATNTNGAGFVVESAPIDSSSSIRTDGVSGISLDLSSSGLPHLGYAVAGDARYTYKSDISSWHSVTISEPDHFVGSPASIALDSNDAATFVIPNSQSEIDEASIWRLENLKGTPSINDLSDGNNSTLIPAYPSIAFDSSDKAYILNQHYNSADGDSLQLRDSTNWASTSTIYQSSPGDPCEDSIQGTELAIDSNDKLHIATLCQHIGSRYIVYFTNKSGAWVGSQIENTGATCSFAGKASSFPSIRLDRNDKVHIAFSDCSEDVIKYATDASGSWVVSNATTADSVDEHLAKIAVDPNGHIHLVYISHESKIFYTSFNGSAWSTAEEIVLAAGDDISGNAVFTSDLRIQGLRGRNQ